jgi:hypothetical protein
MAKLKVLEKPLLFLLLATASPFALAQFQRLPDLGAGGYARSVNANGQIIGAVTDPTSGGPGKPAIWNSGALTLLPTGRFDVVFPNAINNSGVIVGLGQVGATSKPIEWINGVLVELPDLGQGGSAIALNDAGQIVGSVTVGQQQVAATWIDGQLKVLSALAFGQPDDPVTSSAVSINASGQILGNYSVDFKSDRTAVLWQTAAAIPVSLGATSGLLETTGYRITTGGKTLLSGYNADSGQRVICVLNADLTYTTLTPVADAVGSHPIDLTDGDIVSGYALFFDQTAGNVTLVPTVWQGGTPTALPVDTGFPFGFAYSANDSGQIVGSISSDLVNSSIAGVWTVAPTVSLTVNSVTAFAQATVTVIGTALKGGKPLVGKKVAFSVGKASIGVATTNSSGQAALKYTMPSGMQMGVQPLLATLSNGKRAQASITLKAAPTVLSVRNATGKPGTIVPITGTLGSSVTGKPLPSQAVTAASGSVVLNAVTTADGGYRFNFPVPKSAKPGSRYPITLQFRGNNEFKASTLTTSVIVN